MRLKRSGMLNLERLLCCPMPVIKTQNALRAYAVMGQLKVVCTDPGTMHDILA